MVAEPTDRSGSGKEEEVEEEEEEGRALRELHDVCVNRMKQTRREGDLNEGERIIRRMIKRTRSESCKNVAHSNGSILFRRNSSGLIASDIPKEKSTSTREEFGVEVTRSMRRNQWLSFFRTFDRESGSPRAGVGARNLRLAALKELSFSSQLESEVQTGSLLTLRSCGEARRTFWDSAPMSSNEWNGILFSLAGTLSSSLDDLDLDLDSPSMSSVGQCNYRLPVHVLQKIASGGLSNTIRHEVWPYLLGLFDVTWSSQMKAAYQDKMRHEYASLRGRCLEIYGEYQNIFSPRPHEAGACFLEKFLKLHRNINDEEVRASQSDIREYRLFRNRRIIHLDAIRVDFGVTDDEEGQGLDSRQGALRLTLVQRLAALMQVYSISDNEIGYCQGMSDLAAPLVRVFEENSIAYWSYCALMSTENGGFGWRTNFSDDEMGIKTRLQALKKVVRTTCRDLHEYLEAIGGTDYHCSYRMVIVFLRREMSQLQSAALWEIVWAESQLLEHRALSSRSETVRRICHDEADGSLNFFICILASVLRQHKLRIMRDITSYDDLISFFMTPRSQNNLNLDVWTLISQARRIREEMEESLVAASVISWRGGLTPHHLRPPKNSAKSSG